MNHHRIGKTDIEADVLVEIGFVVEFGSIKLSKDKFTIVDAPFHLVNKAGAYSSIVRTGRNGYGGPKWEALKCCEASVRQTAARAIRQIEQKTGRMWSTTSDRYSLSLVLEFGDRVVQVTPKDPKRKAYTRTDRGIVRCRKIGLDKASQAILDGLQGPIFGDDEQTVRLLIDKIPRVSPGIGDRASIVVRTDFEQHPMALPGGLLSIPCL